MKSVLLIFIISLSLGLSSCMLSVPSEMKYVSRYCFTGKNTGLDTLINIHGYYTLKSISGFYALKPKNILHNNSLPTYDFNKIKNIDTSDIYFIFYPDGTLLYNFFPSKKQSIAEYLKNIAETAVKGEKESFYKNLRWGSYKVDNGIIKAQWFNIPISLNDHWYSGEEWFQIISENELQKIDHPRIDVEKAKANGIVRFKSPPATFTSVEVLPSPDAKIKEKDWFWCKSPN